MNRRWIILLVVLGLAAGALAAVRELILPVYAVDGTRLISFDDATTRPFYLTAATVMYKAGATGGTVVSLKHIRGTDTNDLVTISPTNATWETATWYFPNKRYIKRSDRLLVAEDDANAMELLLDAEYHDN